MSAAEVRDLPRLCWCGCGAVIEGNPKRRYVDRGHYQSLWRTGRTMTHRRAGTTARQITLRLTIVEYDQMLRAAERANLTISGWTSELVVDTLKRNLATMGESVTPRH